MKPGFYIRELEVVLYVIPVLDILNYILRSILFSAVRRKSTIMSYYSFASVVL